MKRAILRIALIFSVNLCLILPIAVLMPVSVRAQGPPKTPDTFSDSFETGYLFFDDAVGVLHVRQSGSTAETDYAPGIPASTGGFYARLLVQPSLQLGGGINGDQSGAVQARRTTG